MSSIDSHTCNMKQPYMWHERADKTIPFAGLLFRLPKEIHTESKIQNTNTITNCNAFLCLSLISFLAFDSGLYTSSINPCSKNNITGVQIYSIIYLEVILMSFSNACWWTELAFLQDNGCFQQLLLLYFFATNKLTRPPCDSFVLIKPGTKGKNFSHSFQFNCCYFLAPLEKSFVPTRESLSNLKEAC